MATTEDSDTSRDPEETKPEQESKIEAGFDASEPEAVVTPATRTVDDAENSPRHTSVSKGIRLSKLTLLLKFDQFKDKISRIWSSSSVSHHK